MHKPALDDLAYFAALVEHGGISAAARALDIPRSRLSRRLQELEDRVGVRLVQRTTRHFSVTAAGEQLFAQVRSLQGEAESALEALASLTREPRGRVRMSCPTALAQGQIAPILPGFMRMHPKVELQIEITNRRVDLVAEGVDIALRVRQRIDEDLSLVVRTFGTSCELLVASPKYLAGAGALAHPHDLATHSTLGMGSETRMTWELHGPGEERQRIEHAPRLVCRDFQVLQEAARQGLGITLLPQLVCAQALSSGELVQVLPEWSLPQGVVHAAYPTRRGQLPAVRALLDYLSAALSAQLGRIADGERC